MRTRREHNYIIDDVINPSSGHRIGTAEVELALVGTELVAEAAVIGFPHEIKGEGIGCFSVILKRGAVGMPQQQHVNYSAACGVLH